MKLGDEGYELSGEIKVKIENTGKEGVNQMRALSNLGMLSRFVGMLTDSICKYIFRFCY